MNLPVQNWQFTVDDFHRMVEVGILREDDRVELLQGVIFRMSPIGSRHNACIARINSQLQRLLGDSAILMIQSSFRLAGDSEPQPDVLILRPREDFYEDSLPTPVDVYLLIEVADSTVEFDRNVKLPLYAKAGVVEYWLVDLPSGQIETYCDPVGNAYQTTASYDLDDGLSPLSFPQLSIRVDEIIRERK